ncbi:MAG: TetR/AcrR family transcriptional regulator [Planctomycetota bacterium]
MSRMPQEQKRRQIMQAAEKLFVSRRFHEITLDEVARRAQVGKGTIYLYFKDKDDLFFQTALAGFDDLCNLLAEKIPANAPFEEQLNVASLQISSYFQRRRQVLRMIQAEDARMFWCKGEAKEAWKQKRQCVVDMVVTIMRHGVQEGKVRTDIPPQAMANILMEMLRMQAPYLANVPDAERHIHMLVDLFYRGAGWSGACAPASATKAAAVSQGNKGGA